MNRRTLSLVVLLGLLATLAACSRDPNVRKRKYLESGQRYYDKQQYREAVIQFSNALQVDPRFAEGHYRLAQAYMRLSAWSSAYAELTRTLDLQPGNLRAQLDLATLLMAGGRVSEARLHAQAVLQKEPNNPDALAVMARGAALEGKNDEALALLRKAIASDPKRSAFYVEMALILSRSGQIQAAEDSLKKAVAVDPRSANTLSALGTFYQQQKRMAEAEQRFREAVSVDPTSVAARVQLANFYLSQQQKDKAEQVLAETKKAMPDNADGYWLLGQFYAGIGDMNRALAEFASLYHDHPKDLRLKKNYIELLLKGGRTEEATRLTQEILKANARDVDGLILQGAILRRQNKPKEAILPLESALKMEPDNAAAHYQMGMAAAAIGDTDKAEAEWREAVRLEPNYIEALRALAAVAANKGDANSLAASAERLVQLQPNDPAGYVLRAAAESSRGEATKAESDLQKVMEIAPQSPAGYLKMGQLRLAQKRYGDADKLFEQALEKDPGNVEAMQSLVASYGLEKQPPAKIMTRVSAQIAKSPNTSGFYSILGQLQTVNKDLQNAQSSLEKAVALDKNNDTALMLLGQVQVALGAPEKATALWQKWIQDNPQDARGYLLLGSLEDSRGNWQKAQDLYQKALQLQPDSWMAANNLAYLMLQHGGNPDVALTLAQTARRGMGTSPNTADTLAWAYYQKGVYGSAIDLLEGAVKQDPRNASYQYHLGLAYQKNNNAARAREHLQKALEIDPKMPEAEGIRRTLASLGRG